MWMMERVGHGDLQHLREGDERIGRALADHAVAGEDDRVLRRRDQLGGVFDLRVGSDGRVRRLHGDRLLLDLHLRDVLGEVDEGAARLLGLRDLEGLAHHFRHDLGCDDLRAVLRDRLEHVHEIEDLVAFLVQARGGTLPRDRDDGRAVHVRVRNAGDEVGGARAERGHANARAPGEAAIHIRHERRALLVVAGDELDRAAEQCIHHVDVLFTRNAEDVLHAFVLQALDQKFGGGKRRGLLRAVVGHGCVLREGW